MIDFPMTDLLDDTRGTTWRGRHLHPAGVKCPRCGSPARRLLRQPGHFPASRCRRCHGYDTLLTGTVLAKPHQQPAPLGLGLRGMAKGEPTARLARELRRSRQQLHTLRQRLQPALHARAPPTVLTGTAFEADARDHNAGETRAPPSRCC
jgi:hypothetical protein